MANNHLSLCQTHGAHEHTTETLTQGLTQLPSTGHGVYFAFKGMKVIMSSKQDLIN